VASTPEAKVKKSVRQVLDRNGLFYGVECKAGKGKPTELQLLNMRKIIKAGGVALVVYENDISYLESLLTTGVNNEKTNI